MILLSGPQMRVLPAWHEVGLIGFGQARLRFTV
jgi:hypothetical protein